MIAEAMRRSGGGVAAQDLELQRVLEMSRKEWAGDSSNSFAQRGVVNKGNEERKSDDVQMADAPAEDEKKKAFSGQGHRLGDADAEDGDDDDDSDEGMDPMQLAIWMSTVEVPEEPAEDDPERRVLKLVLPDRKTLQRAWLPTNTYGQIFDFVRVETQHQGKVQIVANHPRKVHDDAEETLAELGKRVQMRVELK